MSDDAPSCGGGAGAGAGGEGLVLGAVVLLYDDDGLSAMQLSDFSPW